MYIEFSFTIRVKEIKERDKIIGTIVEAWYVYKEEGEGGI